MRLFSIILLMIIFIAMVLMVFGCAPKVRYIVVYPEKTKTVEWQNAANPNECEVFGCLVAHSRHDLSPDCDFCRLDACPEVDTLKTSGGLYIIVYHRKIKL